MDLLGQVRRVARRHPVALGSCGAVAALVGVYLGVYWWASMPGFDPLPAEARAEAMELLAVARDSKGLLPRRPRRAALRRKVMGPVFVKLYLRGEAIFEHRSRTGVVLWDALLAAARRLRGDSRIQGLSEGDRQLSRFKVDIGHGRAPIVTRPEVLFAMSLVPGVDGLGVTVRGRTAYLDPDESLRRGLVTGYQPFKFVREFKAGLHVADADEYLGRQLGMWEDGRYRRSARRYFRFRTEGFVEAPWVEGKRTGPLDVYRGNTPAPRFNRQAVINACVAGGNYVMRQLMRRRGRVAMRVALRKGRRPKLWAHILGPAWRLRTYRKRLGLGQFKYIYYPLTDNYDVGGYSLPRHAGTTYALALLYGRLKGRPGVSARQVARFGEGARVAIRYLTDMVRRGRCRSEAHDYVCVARGGITDLGSSALPLVALMEYQRQTGDRQYERLGRRLANFLLYMQRGDGEFCHRYDVGARRKLCKEKLLYYSGEAALALALAYDQLRDDRYKEATRRALDYLTGESYWPLTMKFLFGEDHWTCIAAEAAWPHIRRKQYARFCYEFAAFQRRQQFLATEKAVFDYEGGYGITPFFPPHLTPAGSRTEAMVSTYSLSRHRGEAQEVIRSQVVRAFKYILRHQVRLENSYLFVRPRFSVGAIRKSPIKYEVRIDYVQHTVAAMIRGLDLVPR